MSPFLGAIGIFVLYTCAVFPAYSWAYSCTQFPWSVVSGRWWDLQPSWASHSSSSRRLIQERQTSGLMPWNISSKACSTPCSTDGRQKCFQLQSAVQLAAWRVSGVVYLVSLRLWLGLSFWPKIPIRLYTWVERWSSYAQLRFSSCQQVAWVHKATSHLANSSQ